MRMSSSLGFVATLAIVVSGCTGSSSAPVPSSQPTSVPSVAASPSGAPSAPAPSTATIDKTPITVAWNGTPSQEYLPLLMALDDMKSEGYQVAETVLNGSDLTFQALSSNQIQFTADSLPPGALSVDKGAPIKIIGARNADLTAWVTLPEYQDCSKLAGKPVGIYSQTGGWTILMELYFQAKCPGVKPTYVTIPDSALRAQALAGGRIDGTALGLDDALTLDKQYPGKFFIVYFGQDMPGIGDEYVYTNTQTISDHPSIVEALLADQLKAIRSLYADPSQVVALDTKYLPDINDPAVVGKRFLDNQLYYANGGLANPGLEATLKAFSLPGNRASLVDDGPMKNVLNAIGQSSATKY